MPIYIEGLAGYIIFADALIYFVMSYTMKRFHNETSHWVTAYWPLDKGFAMVYLVLTLWICYLLFRMQLLQFWL